MKVVTKEQFHIDFCKTCVYNGICTEEEKEKCYSIDNKDLISYQAKSIYGEETKVIF